MRDPILVERLRPDSHLQPQPVNIWRVVCPSSILRRSRPPSPAHFSKRHPQSSQDESRARKLSPLHEVKHQDLPDLGYVLRCRSARSTADFAERCSRRLEKLEDGLTERLFSYQTRRIVTSVVLTRAATVWPGFGFISGADRAVILL